MTPDATRFRTLLRRWGTIGLVAVLLSGCAGDAGPGPAGAPGQGLAAAVPSSSPGPQPTLARTTSAAPSVAADFPPPPAPSASSSGPLPARTESPAATGAPVLVTHAANPGPFVIDLYRRGDFVSQARSDWCVPAAIQTMANIIDRRGKASLPSQRVLDRRSRALSSPRLVGAGSEPQGLARLLNRLGYGPYVVVAEPTRREAIAAAARALRLTGRPVGLLVWRGAHAWVMSGFEATADPARTDAYRVTWISVSDPWYPRSSAGHGPTRPPDATIGGTVLVRNYLSWRRPFARYAELDGRFVLVLPVTRAG